MDLANSPIWPAEQQQNKNNFLMSSDTHDGPSIHPPFGFTFDRSDLPARPAGYHVTHCVPLSHPPTYHPSPQQTEPNRGGKWFGICMQLDRQRNQRDSSSADVDGRDWSRARARLSKQTDSSAKNKYRDTNTRTRAHKKALSAASLASTAARTLINQTNHHTFDILMLFYRSQPGLLMVLRGSVSSE